MIKYRLENPDYVMFDEENGEELVRMEEVALAFSIDSMGWTLHKHGKPKHVERWLSNRQKMLREAGHSDIAQSMVMISGKFSASSINRCLDTSGFIKIFCKSLGIEDDLLKAAGVA